MPKSLFKWLSRKANRTESSAAEQQPEQPEQPSTEDKPENADADESRMVELHGKRKKSSVKSSVVDQHIIPPVPGLLDRDDTAVKLSKAMKKLDSLDADTPVPKRWQLWCVSSGVFP